jgi:hypothetical protein
MLWRGMNMGKGDNCMKRLGIVLGILFGVMLFAFSATPAQACSLAANSTAKAVSQNEKYVLISMMKEGNRNSGWSDDGNLREKYKQPGLYPNNGSTTPLWTMPFEEGYWFKFGWRIYTSTDGRYLVSISDTYVDTPLVFIKEGKYLRTYSFAEVSADTSNDADCKYEWISKVNFKEAEGILTVEHLNGTTLSFSIYTGERVTAPAGLNPLSLIWLWTGVGFLILGIIGLYLWRRRQERKPTR